MPHYCAHILPIWLALPEDIRGKFYVRANTAADRKLREHGIATTRFKPLHKDQIVLVAGFEDYRQVRPARCIFYGHGVGQTYNADPKSARMSSYSGGKNRERTVLFLCSSTRDAQTNRDAYDVPAIPVGVPYLDDRVRHELNHDRPVVGVSFHADIFACAETRSAWSWARSAMVDLVRSGEYEILGHAHPRIAKRVGAWWQNLGVRFEPDWLKVLPQIDCYVIDNSSTGYEAAALGIPTVWLSPPFYRRDVHHGLRFWDAIPGVEVDDLTEFPDAIKLALDDSLLVQQKRATAIEVAYSGLIDGHSTKRAVDAICQLTSA